MKKAMAITACRRPEYLLETLASLRANDNISDFTLYIGVEPVNADVIRICKSIDFIRTNVVINNRILGVKENPFQTMKRAFDDGHDLVWQLEEDVIVSPVASDLVSAYCNYEFRNEYLCLNLFNPESSAEKDPAIVYPSKGFNALSLAITKEQWNKWFLTNYHKHPSGWDFSFTDLLSKTELCNLTPAISHSEHIGRDDKTSTHYRRKEHDPMYCNKPWKSDSSKISYTFKR